MNLSECGSAQEFLKSAFDQAKELDPSLTIQRYAKRVGLGCSSLKMILSDKRKPTLRQILAVARSLRLNATETAFLETLVLKDSARGSWEKAYYAQSLQQKKGELKPVTGATGHASLLKDLLALPLLVDLLEPGQTELEPVALARRFKTTPEHISRLLADLQTTGVLQQKPEGGFHVVFDKFRHRPLQKKYLQKLLAEASRRIDREYDKPDSLFVSYTLSVSQESLVSLKFELKALIEKYMNAESIETPQRQIAQACFQVFPVTSSES